MQIPNEYREIMTSLLEKTQAGLVHWKRQRFDVSVTIDKNQLSLWNGTDETTERGYVSFALKDEKGSTIDTWYVDEGDADYSFMDLLYSAAKRHALGVPNTLRLLREKIANSREIGDPAADEE